jgi:hypothetical protein
MVTRVFVKIGGSLLSQVSNGVFRANDICVIMLVGNYYIEARVHRYGETKTWCQPNSSVRNRWADQPAHIEW